MNEKVVISTIEDILIYFRDKVPNGDKYYLLNSGVITNIPEVFYTDPRVLIYKAPKDLTSENEKLLSSLANYIDLTHFHPSLPNFKLNACFENSSLFFRGVDKIRNETNLKVSIVFGSYSHHLPYAETPEGYIINNTEVVIHDWHIWNYTNGMLIDTTILKQQHTSPIFIKDWGNVEDHIFVYPNEGDIYQGIEFTDYSEFERYFKSLFGI